MQGKSPRTAVGSGTADVERIQLGGQRTTFAKSVRLAIAVSDCGCCEDGGQANLKQLPRNRPIMSRRPDDRSFVIFANAEPGAKQASLHFDYERTVRGLLMLENGRKALSCGIPKGSTSIESGAEATGRSIPAIVERNTDANGFRMVKHLMLLFPEYTHLMQSHLCNAMSKNMSENRLGSYPASEKVTSTVGNVSSSTGTWRTGNGGGNPHPQSIAPDGDECSRLSDFKPVTIDATLRPVAHSYIPHPDAASRVECDTAQT